MSELKSILIVMAMQDEANQIIKSLNLIDNGLIHPQFTIKLFYGRYNNLNINILLNGKCSQYSVDHIGTQIATLATQIGIEKLKPNIVVNAGTAGGFLSDNAKIGDIYLSHPYVCYQDRRINIPNFKEYGIGYFPSMPCEEIAKTLGFKTGIVTTGNSLDCTEKDLEIIKSYNGVAKDMEAPAIAWIAQQYKIPFLAIKAITDIVDGEKATEEEFLHNLESASKILSKQTIRLLELISKS